MGLIFFTGANTKINSFQKIFKTEEILQERKPCLILFKIKHKIVKNIVFQNPEVDSTI